MWCQCLIVLALCTFAAYSLQDVKENFKRGMREYAQTGKKSASFGEFMSTISFKHAFRQDAPTLLDNELLCDACDAIVETALVEIQNGLDIEAFVTMIIDICVSLNIEPRNVCEGAIRLNVDPVIYIARNRPDISSKRVCATVLQDVGCEGPIDFWEIDLAEGNTIEKEKGLISDGEPLKVIQLADIHYDPMYLPGGYGNCDEPLCCQSDLGLAVNPADAAGYWGDYRSCGTPRHVFWNALEHINEQHPDVDYIYFTGDVIRHRVWETSIKNNTQDLRTIFGDLREAFPNIPVFPIFGNHEAHPVNIFAPLSITDETVSTHWLYNEMAEVWGEWLPAEAKETVRKGGFYTILLRQGFRLIALNSNIGYTSNWWTLYEDVDPFGMLQWLADTLYEAEQNGEMVHIISHIPSGDGTCYLPWSRQFRRIVERFSNTITAMFNGHSHNDEWLLYHSRENPSEAINIAWNGGALTSYSNLNFNYKVYAVDNENYEVVDIESWTYNVTDANLTPSLPPVWFKLYSFKDAFGLNSLAPKDIRILLERMTDDHSLMQLHYRHRYRDADSRGYCDDNCMRSMMCRMVTMEFNDNTQCNDLLSNW